jgi:hypothetical protein
MVGLRLAVVVRQVAPGNRLRAPFWMPTQVQNLEECPEAVAAALFNWLSQPGDLLPLSLSNFMKSLGGHAFPLH